MNDKKVQIAGYEYVIQSVVDHGDLDIRRIELREQQRIIQAGNWAKRKVIDILQRQTRHKAFWLIIEERVNDGNG